MTTMVSGRTAHSAQLGLSSQMKRVSKALRLAGPSLDAAAVHRLRVALRRCRSVAALLEEVDLHPGWAELKQRSRKLFKTLGTLRDSHVLEHWIKELTSADDSARIALLATLEHRRPEPHGEARRVVKQFDRHAWKNLARSLSRRARVVPPNGRAAQCLALERYEEVRRLHVRALRSRRSTAWHDLRVAVKRFRYTVESLLPVRLAHWQEDLRQVQNLLGEIHDLDVLDAFVAQEVDGRPSSATVDLREAIGGARRDRVEQYRQRTIGSTGLLSLWKAGLPQGARVDEVVVARLHATVRAMDKHPDRAVAVTRLALRLFDTLVARDRRMRDSDGRTRALLRAAALLHSVRGSRRRGSRQKTANDVLRAMRVPPGWTAEHWELVTLVVSYHRGAEPAPSDDRLAHVRRSRFDLVRGLAGILRFARALDRCGATNPRGIQTEATSIGIRLRVPGLIDSQENAARLAAAKHLLELDLGRSLVVESAGSPGLAKGAATASHGPTTSTRVGDRASLPIKS